MTPEAQGLQPGSYNRERQEGFLRKAACKGGFEGRLKGVLGLGTAWTKAQSWEKGSVNRRAEPQFLPND